MPAMEIGFFPRAGALPTGPGTTANVHQVKGPQYTYQHRIAGGAEGVFRCEIGSATSRVTYYVGIYASTPSGNGE